MTRFPLACIAAFLAACSSSPTYERLDTTPLTNYEGHVIGHRETVRNIATGEQVEHVVDYTPRYDSSGTVVGYEEPLPEGVQLRSLDGKRLGVRYRDLRGRGVNPTGEGVSVTVPPK